MSQPDDTAATDATLASDGRFEDSLKRVSFEPGMLLGIEATRAEQDYHRRRHTRHAYWLHGSGTVVGLRVDKKGDPAPDDVTAAKVRLVVTPGIGVDGLGREVSVFEPYCIDLSAWLSTQHADEKTWNALVEQAYDIDRNALCLKVTMRFQDCPAGLQPRLAVDVNAGTDPVGPSRIQDCVLFELVPEAPAKTPERPHPFAAHNGLDDFDGFSAGLSDDEKGHLDAADQATRAQLEVGTRLLHALSSDNQALLSRENLTRTAADLARTLLARVWIQLTPTQELIVNPQRVSVDNLVRPFLFNASTLALLLRQ